jgi:hypothetical protein
MRWIRALLASIVVSALGISACMSRDEGRERQGQGWTRGFYWGTATAGFQVEGNAPDSNWRRYVDRSLGSLDHLVAVPSTRTKMPMTSGIATVKTLPMHMLWESTHSDSASNGPV